MKHPRVYPGNPNKEDHALDGSGFGYLLSSAVRGLDEKSIEELLRLPGLNVNDQDSQGMTPLHHAAALGFRPAVRALVNDGRTDYLIRDNHGRYPFELALEWSGDIAVARLLEKKQMQQAAARGIPAYIPRVNALPSAGT